MFLHRLHGHNQYDALQTIYIVLKKPWRSILYIVFESHLFLTLIWTFLIKYDMIYLRNTTDTKQNTTSYYVLLM